MIKATIIMICCALFLMGCSQVVVKNEISDEDMVAQAIFAGGCFWCSEQTFEQVPGVVEVISGFTGGESAPPSYDAVARGETDHREAVLVIYDPENTTYAKLLDAYWKHINPTDIGGQFADRGFQYSPAIFYSNEEEKSLAEKSLVDLNNSQKFEEPIVVPILEAKDFYPADDYHQDYYKKNPVRYGFYKRLSGREGFIDENWKE